jgi:hypothetical protein
VKPGLGRGAAWGFAIELVAFMAIGLVILAAGFFVGPGTP